MNDQKTEELVRGFAFDIESEMKIQDLSFLKGVTFSLDQKTFKVRFIVEPVLGIDLFEICSEVSSQFVSRIPNMAELEYKESIVINQLDTPIENFNLGSWIYLESLK